MLSEEKPIMLLSSERQGEPGLFPALSADGENTDESSLTSCWGFGFHPSVWGKTCFALSCFKPAVGSQPGDQVTLSLGSPQQQELY